MTEAVTGFFDVGALPTFQSYGTTTPSDVAIVFQQIMRQTINAGIIEDRYEERSRHTFGYALGVPFHDGEARNPSKHWNEPGKFVWLVGGWGHHKNRYIANAVRKLRAVTRLGQDTLPLALDPELRKHNFVGAITEAEIEHEKDLVNTDPTHTEFRWGDFTFGGGVILTKGGIIQTGAGSGDTQQNDDDIMKRAIGTLLDALIDIDRKDAAVAASRVDAEVTARVG